MSLVQALNVVLNVVWGKCNSVKVVIGLSMISVFWLVVIFRHDC